MVRSLRSSTSGPASAGLVATLILAACTSQGAASAATVAPASKAPASVAPASVAPSSAPSSAASSTGPAMVAVGTFHGVDGTASGTAALEHLADGTFAIVFEDFSIESAAHTNVVLLPVKDVKTDGDVDKSAILDLGPLKGTSGMQDYPIPASSDAMGFHTVVLWDTEMAHAVAAAPLQ